MPSHVPLYFGSQSVSHLCRIPSASCHTQPIQTNADSQTSFGKQKTGQNYFIFYFHSVLCAVCCFEWLFSGSASGANGQEQKTGQNYFIFYFHSVLCAVCCFEWLFSGSASGANGQVEFQFAA